MHPNRDEITTDMKTWMVEKGITLNNGQIACMYLQTFLMSSGYGGKKS